MPNGLLASGTLLSYGGKWVYLWLLQFRKFSDLFPGPIKAAVWNAATQYERISLQELNWTHSLRLVKYR